MKYSRNPEPVNFKVSGGEIQVTRAKRFGVKIIRIMNSAVL